MMLSTESWVVRAEPRERSEAALDLFVDTWDGSAKNGRVLLALHGLGEHGGRYRHLPEFLGEDFERFYSMDQRGHGRSGGLRGYSPSFEQLLCDLDLVAKEISRREPGKKIVLLSHSFGGLVALAYLISRRDCPFERAIISAPLLGILVRIPPVKKFVGEVVGRVLPKLQLTNELNPSLLSHDSRVVEAYVKDRLVHQKITPRLYLEMTAKMNEVNSYTGALPCPVLFIVPGQDQVVDSGKALALFRGLKHRDKELREYPDFYHESLNETGKARVFEDIRKWLHKNIATN